MMVAVAVSALALSAQAIPTLQLQSNGSTVTVVDGGAGDLSFGANDSITWLGSVGGWNLNLAIAVSGGSQTAPSISLDFVSGSVGGSPLTVLFSDTGFGPSAANVVSSISGGSFGGGSVLFETYADAGNQLFGTGTLLESQVYQNNLSGSSSTPLALGYAYSLTEKIVIDSKCVGLTKFCSSVEVGNGGATVPDGGMTLVLLGSSLTGLAVFARSRKFAFAK
ncbi:MAG: hypothetical protein WCS70_02705 [Verrucomicrobiota bacterium]